MQALSGLDSTATRWDKLTNLANPDDAIGLLHLNAINATSVNRTLIQ